MNACSTKDHPDKDFRTRSCGKMVLDGSEVRGKGITGRLWEGLGEDQADVDDASRDRDGVQGVMLL